MKKLIKAPFAWDAALVPTNQLVYTGHRENAQQAYIQVTCYEEIRHGQRISPPAPWPDIYITNDFMVPVYAFNQEGNLRPLVRLLDGQPDERVHIGEYAMMYWHLIDARNPSKLAIETVFHEYVKREFKLQGMRPNGFIASAEFLAVREDYGV